MGWRPWHVVAAVVLTTLGIIAGHEAWSDIIQIGLRDGDQSYVFIAPLLVAWLIWVRRKRLRQCAPTGQWAGPVLVAFGWLCSWYGYNNAVESLWHGGAVFIAAGCFISVVGTDIVYRFMPAFVALLFMIPVPGSIRQGIAVPLQTISAHVTQNVLDIIGASDVSRSGSILSINGHRVAIAEACNGMRMVFSLFLVSYGYAFGTPLRNRVRAAIILASPFSAILSNVIRLVPTVWIYGNASEHFAKDFHNIAGWAMLGVSFLILTAVIGILRWARIPVTRYTLIYD